VFLSVGILKKQARTIHNLNAYMCPYTYICHTYVVPRVWVCVRVCMYNHTHMHACVLVSHPGVALPVIPALHGFA
jgi:hypothetical protein